MRLPSRATPAGYMFQRKTDEIFKELPNAFGIADEILVKGYDKDGRDYNTMLCRVFKVCRENLIKTNII